MKQNSLDQAARAAGISLDYINVNGEKEAISDDTKRALLAVMGDPHDAKKSPLPPVAVFSGSGKRQLTPQGSGVYHWQLQTEKGKQLSGELTAGESFTLPGPLAQGYHQLTLSKGKKQWQTRIIVTPRRCYLPPALEAGEKRWGALVQLYTVRSAQNWGIGDFGDLQTLLEQLAARGGDFVGLNPLHALYPASADFASPYSPSSRRWLNIIYIDVGQVVDFQQSPAAQKWWKSAKTQRALSKAREAELVDYEAVMALKLAALRLAWAHFQARDAESEDKQSWA
ncbi:MAG TPA: 4-alpha-glucanotransferase, partial [Pantoea sp.]|nr:4-alpha-glucanotransferase [Pantoea sp.]